MSGHWRCTLLELQPGRDQSDDGVMPARHTRRSTPNARISSSGDSQVRKCTFQHNHPPVVDARQEDGTHHQFTGVKFSQTAPLAHEIGWRSVRRKSPSFDSRQKTNKSLASTVSTSSRDFCRMETDFRAAFAHKT
ncbi:hypothetical protein AAHC03_019132 [Spirometra sp. Aus1]